MKNISLYKFFVFDNQNINYILIIISKKLKISLEILMIRINKIIKRFLLINNI